MPGGDDIDIIYILFQDATAKIKMGLKMKTEEAADYFGSRKKLADALGIWPHGTYKWGEFPPKMRQYQIQVLSKGELMAEGETPASPPLPPLIGSIAKTVREEEE